MEITVYRTFVSNPDNQSWPIPVYIFEQELGQGSRNPTVLTPVEVPEGSRFVWEIDPEDYGDDDEPEWFVALPDGERVNAEMLLRRFAAPEVVRSVDAEKKLFLDSFSPDAGSN